MKNSNHQRFSSPNEEPPTDRLDLHYMEQALQLARAGEQAGEVPIGAVAVLNEEIIGRGFNCPISSNDPTAHAEIVALRQAAIFCKNYRLPDLTIYTTLEPCLMCVGALLHARVKRVVFGASDPKAGALISRFKTLETTNLNHYFSFQGGMLASACGELLTQFFRQRRNLTHR